MNLARFSYKHWTFWVDVEATRNFYISVDPQEITRFYDSSCHNFALQRNELFPSEIRQLCERMGIDLEKETYLIELGETENNLFHYEVSFTVIGKFEKTKTEPDITYDAVEITDVFHMEVATLFNFENEQDNPTRFSLDFFCSIPWKLPPTIEEIGQHNLRRMLVTETHSLHRDSFSLPNGEKLENADEVIDLLVKEDLIETERDPDLFFLSQSGYIQAEKFTWTYPEQKTKPRHDFQRTEEEKKLAQKHDHQVERIYTFSKWFILITFVGLITLVSIIGYYQAKTHPISSEHEPIILDGKTEIKRFIDSLEESKR